MPGETFLVTGCAGFIGGHMLERLIAEGFRVRGVDDFSTGDPANLAAVRDRIEFIEGDLSRPAIAAAAVRGVDRVIHLASVPSVPRSVENPGESVNASIVATVNLLDAAVKAGVKRVVQAASSSAYGDSPILPKSETAKPDPLSPYAVAKLAQEYYGLAFSRCYGLDGASLRYFNVFGPRQNPASKYAAVIPKFIVDMLSGRQPVIFGDGGQSRDFTYVDNVVDANLLAATAPGRLGGEVMNIGSGAAVTLNRLVAMLNELLGVSLPPRRVGARTGDVKHSLADIAKAGRLIGYRPRIDLAEGLRRCVEHFKGRA